MTDRLLIPSFTLILLGCGATVGDAIDHDTGPASSDGDSADSDSEADAGDSAFIPIEGKEGSRFVPVWNDEFDETRIDETKWRIADENPEMDLPYRRNWKPENVYIEDGALVLRTVAESDGSFSAGAVRTGYYIPENQWRFGQTYGRFEARIKPPAEQGHWSAFWLFTPSVGEVDGSGQDGTEVDIAEFAYSQQDRVNHALHYDGYDTDHQGASQESDGFDIHDGEWHTFTLEWYPDEYIFYVDGTETWRTAEGGVSQVPQYIKLTDEIGNYGVGPTAWGTGPIEEATLPDYTHIDYVRVWALEATAAAR